MRWPWCRTCGPSKAEQAVEESRYRLEVTEAETSTIKALAVPLRAAPAAAAADAPARPWAR